MIEQTEIKVELSSTLDRFVTGDNKESVRSAVDGFVYQLVKSLTLPVKTSLHLEIGTDLPANTFKVTVNGERCRIPMTTVVSDTTTSQELARLIVEGIYENRELFLTRKVTEFCLERWGSDRRNFLLKTEDSSERFHQALRTLIQRGFRIERATQAVQNIANRSVEQMVHESISGTDAVKIKIFLSKALANSPSFAAIIDSQDAVAGESSTELIGLMQDGLFYELGIVLPNVQWAIDESLEASEFQFQINDLRLLPVKSLAQDENLVNDTVDRLKLINVEARQAFNPANGNECAVIRGADVAATCNDAGITRWDPAGYLILCLSSEIRKKAGALLTLDVVEFMMTQLRQTYPALVNAVSTRFQNEDLACILRDLLDEEISVCNLRSILEGLVSITGSTTTDLSKYIVFFPYTLNLCQVPSGNEGKLRPSDFSNYARPFLRKYISHKYTRGQNTLVVYLVAPEIEARINNSFTQPLDTKEHDALIQAVLSELAPATSAPVILTSIESRKLLRELLAKEFPYLAVLSYQELSPDMNIQPLARITWN
jgi:type III secretion protein V